MNTIINFSNVTKEYNIGGHILKAVDDISFTVEEGEFVVILGPSGAGKTTLLNLLGGMDYVSKGQIIVDGQNIVGLGDDKLTQYRAKNIGFVFQFYNLIPTLTAIENITLMKSIVKDSIDAEEILSYMGMEELKNQFPAELSGGEQQRVSIARAIAKNSKILLCDEPTGALDSQTGIVVLSLLKKMCKTRKKTVLVVSHNAILAEAADKVIKIKNGKITDIIHNDKPKKITEVNW